MRIPFLSALFALFLSTFAFAQSLDRSDPRATAVATLTALQERDLTTLAALANSNNVSFFTEIAEQGEDHPNYDRIYSGWRAEAFLSWTGTVGETRFFEGRGSQQALVPFKTVGDEVIVVVLTEDAPGVWGFEDINSPSASEFETLPTTR